MSTHSRRERLIYHLLITKRRRLLRTLFIINNFVRGKYA